VASDTDRGSRPLTLVLSERFWALAELDSEEEVLRALEEVPIPDRYENSPSSFDSNPAISISTRQARREHKKRMQRWAAKELAGHH
jgi:hypothetical protein